MKRLSALVASLLFCTAALAVPLASGQTVVVGDDNENPFTPSPVAGEANGLYSDLTINVNGSNIGVAAGLFSLTYDNGSGWQQLLAFCLSRTSAWSRSTIPTRSTRCLVPRTRRPLG